MNAFERPRKHVRDAKDASRKSIRDAENAFEGWNVKEQSGDPSPGFFVSVASKGVRFSVSLLFATLAERFVSVAAKGVTLRSSG
jgi:hypothetical protein